MEVKPSAIKFQISVFCIFALNFVCLAAEKPEEVRSGETSQKSEVKTTNKPIAAFDGANLFFSPSVVKVWTVTPNQEPFGKSGVVVNEDGLIITSSNNIDVGPLLTYEIQTSNGKEFHPAKLLGNDPLSGIAALQLEGVNLPFAKRVESSSLEIGTPVTEVGLGPHGQERTAGRITGIGQKMLGLIPGGYENFIQTDVPVDEIKEGGPLMDMEGHWIGINFRPLTERAHITPVGSGVAIPASMALDIAKRLVKGGGRIRRGFLGVHLKDITEELAEGLGREKSGGVLVVNVGDGSPAYLAGMKDGDLILEMDGDPVASLIELRFDISEKQPGSEVELQIFQDGVISKLLVTLGDLAERK